MILSFVSVLVGILFLIFGKKSIKGTLDLPSFHQIIGSIFVICGVVGGVIGLATGLPLPSLLGVGSAGRYLSIAALIGGSIFGYLCYQKEIKKSTGHQYEYALLNNRVVGGFAVALAGLIGLIASFFGHLSDSKRFV